MGFLLKSFIGIAVNGGVLYALTKIVDGVLYTGGIKFFIVGGIVLGFFNFLARPIIKLLSLPFVILSGGIVLILVNVFNLWFLKFVINALAISDVSLAFQSWSTYVIGAVVFGLINWCVHLVFK